MDSSEKKIMAFFIGLLIIFVLRMVFRKREGYGWHRELGWSMWNEVASVVSGSGSGSGSDSSDDFGTCVDGTDGTWGWSTCSSDCGTGQQTYEFIVTPSKVGTCTRPFCADNYTAGLTKLQQDNATQTEINTWIAANKCARTCEGTANCVPAVNCVGSWGDWSACDADNNRTKTYSVSVNSAHGGTDCAYDDGATEEQSCIISS